MKSLIVGQSDPVLVRAVLQKNLLSKGLPIQYDTVTETLTIIRFRDKGALNLRWTSVIVTL